jgi:hypothetical protein
VQIYHKRGIKNNWFDNNKRELKTSKGKTISAFHNKGQKLREFTSFNHKIIRTKNLDKKLKTVCYKRS